MKSFSGFLRWLGMVALVGSAASGCGLSEYQAKMDAQRVRVSEFDEINRLLDDPVEMPVQPSVAEKADAKPAWPFDIFLRLPKGYAFYKTPYYKNFSFYRFQGPEERKNVFIVAATIAEPKGTEEFGKYLPENFRRYVWAAVDDFYFKTYKADPNIIGNRNKVFLPGDKVKYEPFEARFFTPISGENKTIPYQSVIFTDKDNKMLKEHSEFRAFYHIEPGRQICIVVQRPLKTPHETFDKSIEAASLGTLDISVEAAGKRAQFKQARSR